MEQDYRDNVLLSRKIAIRDVLTDLKLQVGCDLAKNKRFGKVLAIITEVKKRDTLSNSEMPRQVGLTFPSTAAFEKNYYEELKVA